MLGPGMELIGEEEKLERDAAQNSEPLAAGDQHQHGGFRCRIVLSLRGDDSRRIPRGRSPFRRVAEKYLQS